jgi:hypothetical protein
VSLEARAGSSVGTCGPCAPTGVELLLGYAFDTDEDRFLFIGDMVHVPTLQFGNPDFTWGYDDDQSTARATRVDDSP